MNENLNTNAINPNNENDNNINYKPNNATNTFNLIIGIATLLIAILGATFAYFSATAQSAENDVTVKSAYVSISYDGGTEIQASNLIPATLNVAMKKYQKEIYAMDENGVSVIKPYDPTVDGEIITDYDTYANDVNRKCVDAKGKEVCYVYQFTIESDGAEGETTDIIASIKINNNDFDNLSYILYEVDLKNENGVVVTDKYGFGIVNTTFDENGYLLNSGYKYINNNFKYKDENPDNLDFAEFTFDKFLKPYDIYGENEELLERVSPVACLFGYVEETDETLEIRDDDTKRCAPKSIENKIKHTYQLVIWLEETGEIQHEQGMTFEGTVSIEVSGGFESGDYGNGQITGKE